MAISLTLIVSMAALTVGGALTEKILGKMGKIEEAGHVGTVVSTMLITTVVTCVGKALLEIKKLSK